MTPPFHPTPRLHASSQPVRPARLAPDLTAALRQGDLDGLTGRDATDARDRALTLLAVYDLHTAPLPVLGEQARFQHHPVVAELKQRLEQSWLAELDAAWLEAGAPTRADDVPQVVQAMRAVAAKDRLPAAYRWLAKEASWVELVDFLAVGKNYWDEMGRGDGAGVHTVLHQDMAAAIGMPHVPREELPVEALERIALGGLLATNRWLQPEMLGALGLIELQAGPRCRLVLQGFDRLGAPAAAYPFYAEHAEVDPVHGKDWMDKAVVPTVAEHPEWGPRIVKGAWWRSVTNLRFFEAVRSQLVQERAAA